MNAPSIFLNLDRERCRAMGVNVSDVFRALSATFGIGYINDFNMLGRTFQVRMNSDAEYRMTQENLGEVYVRNNRGEMIPLTAMMTLERRVLAPVVERFNVFPAAHLMGGPAPGYTSGQALEAMEQVAREVLPLEYTLNWSGQALQEKMSSASTTMIFGLALLMVFLILAAQYESWSLPLAVLTAVPFGVFGAVAAMWLRDMANDVYFQIALVTLVGLAAKNAILIVEFAAEAWREGRSLDVAALRASRLRFRPIIMTSLAFIMGCLPLAISSGAGANSRHAIGTAVIGGMLAATCIATLFVPFFFKNIMVFSQKIFGTRREDGTQ
jgi:multidrug efflux pump